MVEGIVYLYESPSGNYYVGQTFEELKRRKAFLTKSKYAGVKIDRARLNLHKAKEICERYKGVLPSTVTYCDIYIVINSHYHDYVTLYKSWFGDNVDCKIIESAIVFWFMDDDYQYEKKVEKFYMN